MVAPPAVVLLMARRGFTERAAVACARHPWVTISVWVVTLAGCAALYLLWGDVFTTSSKFLNEPDSKRAADLIAAHGGGSAAAQTGAAVQGLAEGIDSARAGADKLAKGSRKLSGGTRSLQSSSCSAAPRA